MSEGNGSFRIALVAIAVGAMFVGAGLANQNNQTCSGEPGSRTQDQPSIQCPAVAPAIYAVAQAPQPKPDPERDEWRYEKDLQAQRNMAHWAFWMVWVSLAGVGVGAVGIIYLAMTYNEARSATNAANETVRITRDIGYGQLRPYVGLRGIECVASIGGFQLQPHWKNFGQTPAVNAKCMIGWGELSAPPDENFAYPDRKKVPTRLELPPGHHIPIEGPNIPNSDLDRLTRTKGKFYIWGWVEYSDGMDPKVRHRTEFCQAFTVQGPRENWKILGVGPHNGSDAECLKKPHT